MRFIVLVSLFIQLVTAETVLHPCTHNEFCIPLSICPMFKQYTGSASSKWPEEVRNIARNKLCNREKIGQQTVYSVCCPSVMNSQTCGSQTIDRISFGQVALPFEFPWMALLRDKHGKFVCGGTLISRRFVLTAAHCINSAKIESVRLGENDITQKHDCIIPDEKRDCAPPPQDIMVTKSTIHPQYSARHKKNDIALLRLKRPATLGASVRTICLPNKSKEQWEVHPSMLIVSGWGLTEMNESFDVLRYAQVPVVSRKDCAPRVQHLSSFLRLDDSQVCAGGVDKVDNCPGDSGGPLQYFYNITSKYIQYGVVSYGVKSCGVKSEPGVYTKVEHFIGWIVEHVDE
ncbi:serine protease grass-like [Ochlerotatus camptorhynchus]|uniref:serine protease grass-like n=1 Tax=Ochlerotatus camptorhynchus TaxID=644619 RepID=UPI0031E29824